MPLSKKLYLLASIFLLAPCSLLHAQLIVPKRDIQPVDSLNRTKPIAPLTVIKNGYSLISDTNGYYKHEHLGRYLSDSLGINRGDYAFWLLDAGDTPVPSPEDSATRNGWVQIKNGIETVNQNTTANFGWLQRSFKNEASSGYMAHTKYLFDSLTYPALAEAYGPFGEWASYTSWDNSINLPFEGGGNLITGIGFNMNPASPNYNPGRPGFNWATEQGYWPGSGNTLMVESHWEGRDTLERGIRNLSIAFNYDGSFTAFSTNADLFTIDQSPDQLTGDGYWEYNDYRIGLRDMFYDFHGRINKQYSGTILEKYSNIYSIPYYRNILAVDDDDVLTVGDSSGVNIYNRLRFRYSDLLTDQIIKSDNYALRFDTVLVDFLGTPSTYRNFTFSAPGQSDRMLYRYDGDILTIGKYNDDEAIFKINDNAPDNSFGIASNGKIRVNMNSGFGGFDFTQFSDDLPGGWMTRDAAQSYYVGNYIDGSDDWVFLLNGTKSFKMQSSGKLSGSEYDATPPTGTPFQLIAHETDGDFISATWDQVIDSLLANGNISDSIYPGGPDTLCFVYLGDEYCVPLDSVTVDVDDSEICFIYLGDTTCLAITGGAVRINDLLSADGPNVIDNTTHAQDWRWTDLVNTGLSLSSSSTAAVQNQTLLKCSVSGANSGNVATYAGNFSNTHTSGSSTNYGLKGHASGSAINYGVFGSVADVGSGVYGYSSGSGKGVTAFSTTGLPLQVEDYTSNTSSVEVLADFKRNADAVPGAGIGGAITFSTITSPFQVVAESGRITSKWVSLTYPGKSQLWLSTVVGGNNHDLFKMSVDSTSQDSGAWHWNNAYERLGINRLTTSNIFINGGVNSPSGTNNIVMGTSTTGDALTSGSNNTILGQQAATSLTTGSHNVVIGTQAAASSGIDVESFKIAIGYLAGGETGGDTTVSMGYLAGGGTDPDGTVAIGYDAGDPAISGTCKRNTYVGSWAASQNGGGSGNVALGYKAGAGGTGNNQLWIDNSSVAASLFRGDFGEDTVRINGDLAVRDRFKESQGADIASASTIALGGDGNTFEITGTTSITLINKTGWINGNTVTLLFSSSVTITDGTANSGSNIGLELEGNTDWAADADDVLVLKLCEIGGTQRWRMMSGSHN